MPTLLDDDGPELDDMDDDLEFGRLRAIGAGDDFQALDRDLLLGACELVVDEELGERAIAGAGSRDVLPSIGKTRL